MSDVVKVSAVDVQRARLLIRLNDALGDSTPAYVRKIADAEPANGSSRNGHTPLD